MKLKRTIGLVLAAVMTVSGLNFSYANEPPNTTIELTDDVTTGSAIESAIPEDEADFLIMGKAFTIDISGKSDNGIAYAVEGGNIYFDATTGTITSADKSITSVIIPNKINGIYVTSIGVAAFDECSNLTSIKIPDSINTIGGSAFRACISLKNIEIPSSVTSIDGYTFWGCSGLTNIKIPSSIVSIKDEAFYGCGNLTNIEIPDSVTSIGQSAFEYCVGLTSIEIPNSVISIGGSAFSDCSNLTSIKIPDSVTNIGNYAFSSCENLTSIKIPEKITVISRGLLTSCANLTNVTLPWNTTIIDDYAFYGCSNLTNIIIPDNVTEIGTCAFGYCGLTSINIPNKVKYIETSAFSGCNGLTDIIIPGNVEEVGNIAFENCTNLKSVIFSEGVKSIDRGLFRECKNLKSVVIPKSVTEIGIDLFEYCGIVTVYCYKNSYADNLSLYPENTLIVYIEEVSSNGKIDKNIKIKSNTHYVIVADTDSNFIEGANVEINGNTYVTDANGMVYYTGKTGVQSVKVTAEEYRENIQWYDVKYNQTKIIFLDKETGDGKPYIVMIYDRSNCRDLRYQQDTFLDDDGNELNVAIQAKWQGHGAGEYVIYQESTKNAAGKKKTSSSPVFKFAPGKVFDRKAGNFYIKLIGADGVESEPIPLKIKIVENVFSDKLKNTTSIKIVPDNKGTVNDSTTIELFPDNYEMLFTAFPVKFNSEFKDGITTYKGTIGIGKSDLLDSESEWSKYKDSIKKAEKNINGMNRLEDLMKAFNAQSGTFCVEKDFLKTKADCIGYVEIKTDYKGKTISSEGGIILNSNLSIIKGSKYFLAGPIPMYIDLEGKVKMKEALNVGYDFDKEKFDFDGELTVAPTIVVDGGIGLKYLATVGGEGSAEINITALPIQNNKAELTAEAALTSYVLFIFDWKWTLAKITVPLWGEENAAAISALDTMALDMAVKDISLASRDYNKYTTEWNPYGIARISTENESIKTDVLQSWIMPHTMPELVTVGNHDIMLFHTDKAERTTGNNIVLMYSLYDEASDTWSLPKAVSEGDSSDLFEKTFVYNDELYVIWQKVRNKLTETDNAQKLLDEMINGTDISVAKWNKDTASFEQEYINLDNNMEMYPTLASDGNNMRAVWATNSNNDITGSEGAYSVMVSDYVDGKWGSPVEIYKTDKSITELSAVMTNGTTNIIFAVDESENKANIYKIAGNKAELIDGQEAFGNTLKCQNNKFYWYSNGKINVYDPISDNLSLISAGENNVISQYYSLTENDNTEAVVWFDSFSEDENVKSSVKASINSGDGWSEPICLYETTDYDIKTADAELNENGTWKIIMNTASESNGSQMSSMVYVSSPVKNNTVLEYASIDECDGLTSEQPVEISLKNESQEKLTSVNVNISDPSTGQTYYNGNVNCDIDVGETETIVINADLSSINTLKELEVTASANGEIDLSDNNYNVEVGCANISLVVNQDVVNGNIVLTATVTNDSYIPTNATLNIFEDSLDSTSITTQDIDNLTRDNGFVYMYSIDRNKINFSGDEPKYFYVSVDTDQKDLYDDNVETVVVYPENNDDIVSDSVEEVQVIDVTGITTPESISIAYDESNEVTAQITAEVQPSNATNKDIIWTSDNEDVALVNSNGVVNVFGIGTAIITAETKDGGFKSYTKVIVTDNPNGGSTITTESTTENTTEEIETVSYEVEGGKLYFDSSTGTVIDADKTITGADIPTVIYNTEVRAIGKAAFDGCTVLKNITIPDTVVSIGDSAFSSCEALSEITLPKNITYIGENVFKGCVSLTTIYCYKNSSADDPALYPDNVSIVYVEDTSPGDIDGDNKITSTDANLALFKSACIRDLSETQFAAADVDHDGKITSTDANFILFASAGLRELQ